MAERINDKENKLRDQLRWSTQKFQAYSIAVTKGAYVKDLLSIHRLFSDVI